MNLEIKLGIAWVLCGILWFILKTLSVGELKVKDFIGERAGFSILGPLALILSLGMMIYKIFDQHGEYVLWRSHHTKVKNILYDKKVSPSSDEE